MKPLAFLLFVALLKQNFSAEINNLDLDRNPRVVGGTDADILEFPSMVSIMNNGRHYCAGTLLNEYWILTAAHCYVPVNQSTIEYATTRLRGNNSSFIAHPELFIRHELFDINEIVYDIGLVKVKAPIIIEIHDAFAKLAMPGSYYATGTKSVVSGWGLWDYDNTTYTPPLQKANLDIWSYRDCKLAHTANPFNLTIHPHQICAGVDDFSKAECSGDSGGGLFVNGVQVGIVSWSVKPCAVAEFPGVYTDVSFFIGWIREKTGIDFEINTFLIRRP